MVVDKGPLDRGPFPSDKLKLKKRTEVSIFAWKMNLKLCCDMRLFVFGAIFRWRPFSVRKEIITLMISRNYLPKDMFNTFLKFTQQLWLSSRRKVTALVGVFRWFFWKCCAKISWKQGRTEACSVLYTL